MNVPFGIRRWPAPALAFVTSRALLFVSSWAGLLLVPVGKGDQRWDAFPGQLWIDGFVRFDAAFYVQVFLDGYNFEPGVASTVNFFPALPGLAGVLSLPLQAFLTPFHAFQIAAMVLSHVSFYAALVLLYRLAARRFDEAAATRTVWLVALFPFSLYFSAPYTESLFLLLTVGAFYSLEDGRWARANALIGVAAITRVIGFTAGIGVALEYLQRRRLRLDRAAWTFIIAPLGVVFLMGYFLYVFDDPLIFARAQAEGGDHGWGRGGHPSLGLFGRGLRRILDYQGMPRLVLTVWNTATLPLTLALGFRAARRLGVGYGGYCLASLAIFGTTGLRSNGRYMAVLFPLFIAAAELLSNRRAFIAVCLAMTPFLIYVMYLFSHWQSVAT